MISTGSLIMGIFFLMFCMFLLYIFETIRKNSKKKKNIIIEKCRYKVIGKVLDCEAVLIGDYMDKQPQFGGYRAKVRYEVDRKIYETYDVARPFTNIYKRDADIVLYVDVNQPEICYDKEGIEHEKDNKFLGRCFFVIFSLIGVGFILGDISISLGLLIFVGWTVIDIYLFKVLMVRIKDIISRRRKVKKCTKRADAVIIREEYNILQIFKNQSYPLLEGKSAVVVYEADGEEHVAVSLTKTMYGTYKKDDNLEIFYNPEDKSCCYDKYGKQSIYVFFELCILILVSLGFIGGYIVTVFAAIEEIFL
ncbi:MAG: hypothetical protein K6G26_06530 [Lachnospiraceae bacterium]|nr:hypothetical protein [Lachnospiraceae bacterium]